MLAGMVGKTRCGVAACAGADCPAVLAQQPGTAVGFENALSKSRRGKHWAARLNSASSSWEGVVIGKLKQGHHPRPSLDASRVPHMSVRCYRRLAAWTYGVETAHLHAQAALPSVSISSSFLFFVTVRLVSLRRTEPSFQTLLLQRLV